MLLGLRGKVRPLISFELARYLRLGCRYDPSLAARELGCDASSIEPALRAAVEWYRKNGFVRPLS